MHRFRSSLWPHVYAFLVLLGCVTPLRQAAADGWPSAHGDPANTGGRDIETSAAQAPIATVSGLGSFADGYAPVVANDGTIILANEQGKVMAFRPDGQKLWERELGSGFSVKSTPVIAGNGNIYVLSSRRVTDHTVNPAVKRIESQFNGFTPGGGLLFRFPIPQHGDGGISTAPLNVMRGPDGQEFVVFPMLFTGDPSPTRRSRLYAYSLTGSLEVEHQVSIFVPDLSSEQGFPIGIEAPGFSTPQVGIETRLPEPIELPLPGVAVMLDNIVVVADRMRAVVTFQFDGVAFREVWRHKLDDPYEAISTPMIVHDGAVKFVGSDGLESLNTMGQLTSINSFNAMLASTPTLAPNGRFLAVSRDEGVIVSGAKPKTGSDSIVSAAASRNFIYVAAYFSLVSIRADTMQVVSSFNWQNGGRVAPVIGPNGEVIAVAGNTLYIFPADTGPETRQPVGGGIVGNNAGVDQMDPPPSGKSLVDPVPGVMLNGGAGMAPEAPAPEPSTPEQQAALPDQQRFDPPLTASGKPLSACVDAKFDDCGKIAARAFCESLGFSKASDIDIDTKKGGAETLAGALCTAKKCKVIDKVTCSR